MVSWAGNAAPTAADKTTEFVKSHQPTEEGIAQAKALAARAGKVVTEETVAFGKEMAQSQTFKNAARGASVGAIVSIPVPFLGPVVGAVIGAGAGVWMGSNHSQPRLQALHQPLPASPITVIDVVAIQSKDLYAELLKLDELRQKGLLTNDEFDAQKQKMLQKT